MAHYNQAPQRAVTLTEVLIAMGILAIGLLGVASVFPVGGYYMQTGEIADRGGAIAQAALEDAIIRGHLDPENWVVHDISRNSGQFMRLTTGETDAAGVRVGLAQAVSDPASAQSRAIVKAPNASQAMFLSATYGDAYIIDPIGLAGAMEVDGNYSSNAIASSVVRHFPAVTYPLQYVDELWAPWNVAGFYWPVRRVTTLGSPAVFNDSSLAYRRQRPIASELFSSADDLALTLPSSGDEPARQRHETWNAGAGDAPSARQSRGDYSWIISVSPASSAVRNALAGTPDANQVEVSAVVFYKRIQARGPDLTADAERLVNARTLAVTPGGGELLLSKRGGDTGESPFEDLKTGQYVMVVGPHPLSTVERPRLALRWCRVLNLEDSGTVGSVVLDNDQNVLVSLRGPDWPWGVSDSISQDLRVAIVPGAVAVHTKTMRLESGSEWSID